MKYKLIDRTFNTLAELRGALNDAQSFSDETVAHDILNVFIDQDRKKDFLDWLDYQKESDVCALLEKARAPRMFATVLLGEDSPHLERIDALWGQIKNDGCANKCTEVNKKGAEENKHDAFRDYVLANSNTLPAFVAGAYRDAYEQALEKTDWASETDQSLESGIPRMIARANTVFTNSEFKRMFHAQFIRMLVMPTMAAFYRGDRLDQYDYYSRLYGNYAELNPQDINCSQAEQELLKCLANQFVNSSIMSDAMNELVREFREYQKEEKESYQTKHAEWMKKRVKKTAKTVGSVVGFVLLARVPIPKTEDNNVQDEIEPIDMTPCWGTEPKDLLDKMLISQLSVEKFSGLVALALASTEVNNLLLMALDESYCSIVGEFK